MPTTTTHPNHEISALIRVQPKEAAKKVLAFLKDAKMHKGDAARQIGCAHSTLISWIRQLELAPEIEKLEAKAKKDGWHHGRVGGRPLGSTVANGAAPRGSKVVAEEG